MQKGSLFLYKYTRQTRLIVMVKFVMLHLELAHLFVEIVENVIYIRSRQTGVDLTIALEDIDGNNIYNVCTTTNDNLSIWISQDILNKAHIITINIDGKEYFGEI